MGAAAAAEPEQHTVVVRLSDVRFEDGQLPPAAGLGSALASPDSRPRAVLDGPGEIYLAAAGGDLAAGRARTVLALSVPAGAPLSGAVLLPASGDEPSRALHFRFEAPAPDAAAITRFLRAKAAHYERVLAEGGAGAAWFRHQLAETRAALGETAASGAGRPAAPESFQLLHSIEDTLALVSGGRAVSENLQLERILPTSDAGEETVPVDSIEGIETTAIDWAPLIAGKTPDLDPLAHVVPDDQHAAFFPRLSDLLALVDEVERRGTPVVAALEPRSEEAAIRQRYEHQLGLPLAELARSIGPSLAASVAVTGADPYLRTGADLALLFQGMSDDLQALLVERVQQSGRDHPGGAATISGQIDDVAFTGVCSQDRTLCSLVASVGRIVVVTNSEAQLTRIIDTWKGRRAPLAAAPEYVFFRDRYRLGEPETAFVVLSDATIRRWCGPRWRIGTSRRTRAEAVMLEVQARHLDELVAGTIGLDAAPRVDGLPDVGPLELGPDGVSSPNWGTTASLTPVLELDLDTVTEAESDLYLRWKLGYESNWSEVFDPIAARIVLTPQSTGLDLSVRPLILDSDYREWIEAARTVRLRPGDGDPHAGTLLHWVNALDKDARALTASEGIGMARMMAPQLDPLSWLGRAVAFYVEDDPFWDEAVAADDLEEFWMQNVHRLPVALHAEVSSGLALTAFLAGARAFLEQTAPDMTIWETRKHGEASYVRVGPSAMAMSEFGDAVPDGFQQLALFYAASGQGLVLSLSERLVREALERQGRVGGAGGEGGAEAGAVAGAEPVAETEPVAEAEPEAEPETEPVAETEPEPDTDTDTERDPATATPIANPWLGESLALVIDRKLLTHVERALGAQEERPLAELSYGNLPILDEWKRRYPDQDPVALHERVFHRRLVCPGGGSYQWNEADRTMESSVYGHPGRPLAGPQLPPALSGFGSARFGLTFEDDGLRAQATLEHTER